MSAPAYLGWVSPQPARPARRQIFGPAEWFLLADIGSQLVLLVPALNHGVLRILWRIGTFAASILLMIALPGKTRSNRTNVAAIWVIGVLLLELFNPGYNTLLAAVAEVVMYLAILAPLFWLTRVEIDLRRFRRIIQMFWGYYSISAGVGMLQVYYPGRFQPPLSPIVQAMGVMAEGMKITLASGATMWRPMGLTDMPGGAATAGMWAILFGLGFLLTTRAGKFQNLRRLIYLGSMLAGAIVIYLSQERVALVVVGVWFGILFLMLLWRARWREFWILAALVGVVAVGGYGMAARLGGKATTARVGTLAAGQQNLYGQDRAIFLRDAFEHLLPDYPFGAGLGRWGMMNVYFGAPTNDPNRKSIYVEIQWQGWFLDGGVPLTLAYLLLLGVAIGSFVFTARRRGPMSIWAALLVAYDLGIFLMTFDYTPFTGQLGVEFWFLNAVVLTAATCAARSELPRWRRL